MTRSHANDLISERHDEVIKRMLATPPQPKKSPRKEKSFRTSDEAAPAAKPET